MDIKPLSSLNDIKAKYKTLSKKYHTDLNGDNQKMQEINWAYMVLKNYIENYKFLFNEEEILRQFPYEYIKKFKV